MRGTYNDHSKVQKNLMKFITDWAYKEGVFQTPQGKFIVRVKTHNGFFRTIKSCTTKEEADTHYNEIKDNHE